MKKYKHMTVFQYFPKRYSASIYFSIIVLFIATLFTNTAFSADLKNWVGHDHYNEGQDVWLELKDKPNDPKAWLGIYPAGTNSDWKNVVRWRWTHQNTQAQSDAHKQQHWFKFPDVNHRANEKSLPEGRYIARLFFNNSYKVESSISFSVGDVEPTSRLKVDTAYKPDIWVKLENQAHANGKDWLGIYPADTNSSWKNVVAWRWAHQTSDAVEEGDWYKFPDVAKGFNKRLPKGKYVARFFLKNTYKVETSVFFEVDGENETNNIFPPNSIMSHRAKEPVINPARRESYIDAAFNDEVTRTVTRVTDRINVDTKRTNSHPYTKHGTSWNSDMSLFQLSCHIYNATTLEEIPLTSGQNINTNTLMFSPRSGCSSGLRWAQLKKDSNSFYALSGKNHWDGKNYGNSLAKMTMTQNRTILTRKILFSLNEVEGNGLARNTQFTMGGGEGNIDYNDRYLVLSAVQGNDVYAVLLDLQSKEYVWGKNNPKKLNVSKSVFDWITISPSGKYILVKSFSKLFLYDRNFTLIRTLANRAAHGDIGYDSNGNEMYLQMRLGGAGIFGYVLNDSRHYQEPVKLLDSNYGGGHISCRNYNRKGWCYVSTAGAGTREVFALKLDGSKTVQHYAQSHETTARAPMVNVSPDGTTVLFTSNFGKNLTYYKRDTYHVKISK